MNQSCTVRIQNCFTIFLVSSSLQKVLDAISVLESTAAYINTSSSSIFDVTVNGVTYTSDVDSVQIAGVVTCDIGLVSTEGLCGNIIDKSIHSAFLSFLKS